ncbi:hypothetical protein IWX91DRAFT_348397, partial [Phyllosticta citricarpa]
VGVWMVSLFLLLFGRRRSVCCHASSTDYLRSAVCRNSRKNSWMDGWMDGWMRDGLTDRDENGGIGRHDDGNTGEVFRLNSFRHCRCCCCRHCLSRPLGIRVESSQFVSSGAVVVVAVLGSVPLGLMMAMDGDQWVRARITLHIFLSVYLHAQATATVFAVVD